MSAALHYPPVTDELLQEVVRRILSVGSPLKIILYTAKRTLANALQPPLRCGFQARPTSGVRQHQHMQIRRHA